MTLSLKFLLKYSITVMITLGKNKSSTQAPQGTLPRPCWWKPLAFKAHLASQSQPKPLECLPVSCYSPLFPSNPESRASEALCASQWDSHGQEAIEDALGWEAKSRGARG